MLEPLIETFDINGTLLSCSTASVVADSTLVISVEESQNDSTQRPHPWPDTTLPDFGLLLNNNNGDDGNDEDMLPEDIGNRDAVLNLERSLFTPVDGPVVFTEDKDEYSDDDDSGLSSMAAEKVEVRVSCNDTAAAYSEYSFKLPPNLLFIDIQTRLFNKVNIMTEGRPFNLVEETKAGDVHVKFSSYLQDPIGRARTFRVNIV